MKLCLPVVPMRAGALVGAIALLGMAAAPAAGQGRLAPEAIPRGSVGFNPAFARNPPKVVGSRFVPVDPSQWGGRNARLEVDYDPADTRVGRLVRVDLGVGPLVLHDDGLDGDVMAGDHRHTAVFSFNFAERNARRQQLLGYVAEGFDTALDFKGRELIGTHPILQDVELMAGQLVWSAVATAAVANPASTLMITDPLVVDDPTRTFDACSSTGTPNGVWTFGYLINQFCQASGTPSADAFVRNWLNNNWATTKTVNGWSVAGRGHIKTSILDKWAIASGGSTTSTLDMNKAPFRLLAIVNRVDLRASPTYGGAGGDAGEARFVFSLVDQTNCSPMQVLVIFEYKIKKTGCAAVKAWGKQWYDLQLNPLGSPAYNAALELITRQFTDSGSDPLQSPNMSTLGQIRTNEINDPTFSVPWELREFTLDSSGHLQLATVKQTPDDSLNGLPVIASYVNSLPATGPLPAVPNQFPGVTPFVGGKARAPSTSPFLAPFFWNAPGITGNRRHEFSLNTCNGCHARESATVFTHVKPRLAGVSAGLSGFLTGITVSDPVNSVSRTFNDLALRKGGLEALVNNSCVDGPFFATHITFPH